MPSIQDATGDKENSMHAKYTWFTNEKQMAQNKWWVAHKTTEHTIASHSSIFRMVTVVHPYFICCTVEKWVFRSIASHIVKVDGSRGTTSKECSLQSYSFSTVSQLSADNPGIQLIPVVITHCTISPFNTHLHCALCCIGAIYQSSCTFQTTCIKICTI